MEFEGKAQTAQDGCYFDACCNLLKCAESVLGVGIQEVTESAFGINHFGEVGGLANTRIEATSWIKLVAMRKHENYRWQ